MVLFDSSGLMGNKQFYLPERRKKYPPDIDSWGKLKNRFAGKTLFRTRLYQIETGDLSVFDSISNTWFYKELCLHSIAFKDINVIPALKKLATLEGLRDGLRNTASGCLETLDELTKNQKDHTAYPSNGNEFEKEAYARILLSGSRYPQTTEILRLLRDKSIEIKRLAIYLIGKFRMSDMIQEVFSCISIKGLEEDSYEVLRSFGKMSPAEVDKWYMAFLGNQSTNKVILRLMSFWARENDQDITFLIERLWSNSRLTRETVLDTLVRLNFKPDGESEEKLKGNILETFGIISWLISARLCLLNNSNLILDNQIEKEIDRWKEYLLGLLYITYGKEMSCQAHKRHLKYDVRQSVIPDIARLFFEDEVSGKMNRPDEITALLRLFRKLQKYFHAEIPSYNKLLEDIINCDYNVLTVWTKACALRYITDISERNIRDSVLALLFSPEEILREETAYLLSRSGKELYKQAAERIPESSRKHITDIIEGKIAGEQLIYEKVIFLSACFKNIDKAELISLAEKMEYKTNTEKGNISQPYNSILWSFNNESLVPEVVIRHDGSDLREMIRDIRPASAFCYVLPLSVISEYGFDHPENFTEVLQYIDSKEG